MLKKLILSIVLLSGALYAATGFYAVEADETAVAFQFGVVTNREVPSGVHWNLPTPLGRQVIAKTKTNSAVAIGNVRSSRGPELWMTGGASLIQIELNIQYSITRLDQFVLSHQNPTRFMQLVAEKLLTRFLVTHDVDDILTTGRQTLRTRLQQQVQRELDEQETGIYVQDVVLLELTPPKQGRVADAFQNVQSARSDRDRDIENARSERTQLILDAKADAHRIVSTARADSATRVLLAKGRTERFTALATEYDRMPSTTEQRLFTEQMIKSLAQAKLYVVPEGDRGKDALSR